MRLKASKEFDFGSIEPLLMDDKFLKRLKKLDKICHHFHLSLQSGCTETLQRMNRRYTAEAFEKIVENLRNTYTDVILTTDIIVGFPGETEGEFEKTYAFLKKIKFYKMHVFKYSVRTGTKAASMENQIPNEIKERRSKKLIQLSRENQEFYHQSYLGKKVEVLVEEKQGNVYKGHTDNYMLVEIEANGREQLENQLVIVQPEKSTSDQLIARNVTVL